MTGSTRVAALLLFLLILDVVPVTAQTAHLTLTGEIEASRCDEIRVAGTTTPVDSAGTFRAELTLASARYAELECGWRLPLFLPAGGELHVQVDRRGEVTFSGSGAQANRYLTRSGELVGRRPLAALLPLRTVAPKRFTAVWDSLRAVDLHALDHLLNEHAIAPPFEEMERARIASAWAHGRLAHPVLHWRDGDADSIRTGHALAAAEEAVDLQDQRLLRLPEFRTFALAYVHERARVMLQQDEYQSGDNRWLRAKYDYVHSTVDSPEVRDFLLHSILSTHLDRNGSEHLGPLLGRFAEDVDDPALLRDLVADYGKERRRWIDDRVETYKVVEGTTLEAHIERPDETSPDDLLPAFVWLHGGSFDTGAWYHCAFVCSDALSQGMVVIRLEQRSADRFHTTPVDQLSDARDALAWLDANADRLRIDPNRIVLGGFSSGATLAVMAGLLEETPPIEPAERPDAVVSIGGCAAPLEGDGWFRKSVGRTHDPLQFSPSHQVRPDAPPMLLIHGTRDEYCEYGALPPFVEAMEAAGNDVVLETLPEQAHFFLFRSPAARADALDALGAFLEARGLTSPPPAAH